MQERMRVFWIAFLEAFVASFWIVLSLFRALCEFDIILNKAMLYMPCILSCTIATIYAVSICIYIKPSKRFLLNKWARKNCNKLIMVYILLLIFLVAVKPEITWSFTEIHNLISLEWTIFGISTAIFLIWNALSINYLNNKKPKKVVCNSILEELKCIQDKAYFLGNINSIFVDIKLMSINLLRLSMTTIVLYTFGKVTVLNQTMVLFTLLLCTNTISGLFFDILKPFNDNKKALIQEMQITEYEETLLNMMVVTEDVTEENVSNEEGKQKVIDAVLEWHRKRREKEEKEEIERQTVHKE